MESLHEHVSIDNCTNTMTKCPTSDMWYVSVVKVCIRHNMLTAKQIG